MSKKLKSIGAFIFGGSATFGAENAGFQVDGILELTDNMKYESAYHFSKNRKDIPIIDPSKWENDLYMKNIQSQNYDLAYANCPCSGLSQINRNASADSSTNIHFYRLFNLYKVSQPKVFVIENAPTLIKMGYPIIIDLIKELSDIYNFSIIRDYAGDHGVAMRRMRTLIIGWRKDHFNNKIPLIQMNKQEKTTVKDIIGDLYNTPLGSIPNHELVKDRNWQEFEYMFNQVEDNSSIMLTVMKDWENIKPNITNEFYIRQIEKAILKKSQGKNIWDKSPWKSAENRQAPSITSVTELIHPVLNRPWTIREYARLMGYPDDFEFYLEETNIDIIQTIAQGVPAEFIKYVSNEIKEVLNGNRVMLDNLDGVLSFQHHTKKKYKVFNKEEILSFNEKNEKGKIIGLDVDSTFKNLEV